VRPFRHALGSLYKLEAITKVKGHYKVKDDDSPLTKQRAVGNDASDAEAALGQLLHEQPPLALAQAVEKDLEIACLVSKLMYKMHGIRPKIDKDEMQAARAATKLAKGLPARRARARQAHRWTSIGEARWQCIACGLVTSRPRDKLHCSRLYKFRDIVTSNEKLGHVLAAGSTGDRGILVCLACGFYAVERIRGLSQICSHHADATRRRQLTALKATATLCSHAVDELWQVRHTSERGRQLI